MKHWKTLVLLVSLPVLPVPAARTDLTPLLRALRETDSAEVQLDILRGMHLALRGRRDLKMPPDWPAARAKLVASSQAEIRRLALVLSVLFGDDQGLAALRGIVTDRQEKADTRQSTLQTLIELKAPALLPLLRDLLGEEPMRAAALRGLSAVPDPGVPALILSAYPKLNEAEKTDAIQTLVSRPAYAAALLDALEQGGVPRKDVSIFAARQVLNLKDAKLSARLGKVWGVIRPTAQDKAVLLTKYKTLATPLDLEKADRPQGRLVFNRICANCHMLFGDGGKIGPDLTGAQRTNPDYILGELLDPGAVVAREYQLSVVETRDGRVINGIVVQDAAQTLTVQTQNERLTLAKADILERQVLPQSMMPEGILTQLTDAEIRNLLGYLAGKEQVTLPASGGR
jgi:putative heme-binding domain-containing protein